MFRMRESGVVVKEWICKEEPLIRADGASVGVGFRQMTELVCCKDCKYYDGNGTCMKNGIAFLEDHFFCADGERQDDDG